MCNRKLSKNVYPENIRSVVQHIVPSFTNITINIYDGYDNKHDIKEPQKTKLANGHILGEVLMYQYE